ISSSHCVSFSAVLLPPRSTPFPYTTLFRSHIVPPGFFGEPLLRVRFIAVAAPLHPLHALGRTLTKRDLRRHRQLVVRDSGLKRQIGRAQSELQSRFDLVCRLLLEKKKKRY